MELPRRVRGDELLPAGAMIDIRHRLRQLARTSDIQSVIACAFDHRTRILPFIYADLKMAPAGVRAIGSAMLDAGFEKTRIVLQQWNPNFRPSQMRLDGKIPDIFMVSSMLLHSAECDKLIRDACQIDPQHRPLIIAGGPRVIYEPWSVFSADPENPASADLAVTGEEYVLLSLLEVLLSTRSSKESLRSAFIRARDSGALDVIPGLVYASSQGTRGDAKELVDTGVQRLLGDLDELPSPVLGYQLLEPPSKASSIGRHALPANRVRKHCRVSSVVMTFGCKFRCAYCPIPAYNQRQHRTKSGERVADEMEQIARTYQIDKFFGTDDNFFNDTGKTLDIAESLARRAGKGRPLCKIRWGTEATVHDTVRLREHLPLVRRSGLAALWMGVEDITASLVRKGQTEDKTLEAFELLRQNGIYPVPMMMHCDTQPLISREGNYGLLNQLKVLRKAGSLYMQVLMLVPAQGSKWYAETYNSGLAYQEVDGIQVEPRISDGNYVIASKHPRPWIKQFNLLAAYTYFFNPARFVMALFRPKSTIPFADAETSPVDEAQHFSRWKKLRRTMRRKLQVHLADAGIQLFGMWGLYHTYRRTVGWGWHLFRGKIKRYQQPPTSSIPMRGVFGEAASHALPGTPAAEDSLVQISLERVRQLPVEKVA